MAVYRKRLPMNVLIRTTTVVLLKVTKTGLILAGRGQKFEGRGSDEVQPEATSAVTPIAGASAKIDTQVVIATAKVLDMMASVDARLPLGGGGRR